MNSVKIVFTLKTILKNLLLFIRLVTSVAYMRMTKNTKVTQVQNYKIKEKENLLTRLTPSGILLNKFGLKESTLMTSTSTLKKTN